MYIYELANQVLGSTLLVRECGVSEPGNGTSFSSQALGHTTPLNKLMHKYTRWLLHSDDSLIIYLLTSKATIPFKKVQNLLLNQTEGCKLAHVCTHTSHH